jgi:thioesterase domain-containing protein
VAPRNDLERAIAAVWASVLGADRVGVEDHFTELGGHSLAAMRVSALLRAGHKIAVSPRDVLRHPTVAALAGIAAAKGAPDGRVSGPEGVTTTYRKVTDGQIPGPDGSLVWFRRSGTGPTLFCVHDTATLCFGQLAEELGPSRPVAALQHPAMVDPGYASMPVTELAALYAGSVRAAAPGGPYHLLGWCAGVPVLWELARLLSAGGGEVVICLLDPKLGDPGSGGSISALARLRHCEELLVRLHAEPGGRRATDLRREILDVLRGLFPDAVRVHDVQAGDVDEGWPEVVRSWREQEQARLDYRFGPLDVPVHLLASDEAVNNPGFFHDGMSYEGYVAAWRRLAGDRLATHRVTGWHDGMLRPPLVTRFALDLAAILDEGSAGA